MKVCIYGAGAIGGWIGMGLARAGCSVSVVARGATLEALQQHGLRLNQAGAVTSQAVTSSASPADLG
ncbi:MAG: 2-dehydropantoate 2-reductase, partial [Bacteroidia bacterium]|nr:2-dehydropantoate 2-reductase [Bacteroidia bacterium]